MKAQIVLISCLIAVSPLFGDPASATQGSQHDQQLSDARVIPGTGWISVVDGNDYCHIYVKKAEDQELGFTVGGHGTLALEIEDIYLERQISSVLPWLKPGERYRAALILDDTKFTVPAMRIMEHGLAVEFKSDDIIKTLYRTKNLTLAVGGVGTCSYKVEGLGIAIPELLECARVHQLRKTQQ